MSEELRPAHEWLVGRIIHHSNTLLFARKPDSHGRYGAELCLDENCDALAHSIIPADKIPEVVNRLRAQAKTVENEGEDDAGRQIRRYADEIERRPKAAPPMQT
jgi:hypothetical protein